jgi:hypothetical protein
VSGQGSSNFEGSIGAREPDSSKLQWQQCETGLTNGLRVGTTSAVGKMQVWSTEGRPVSRPHGS